MHSPDAMPDHGYALFDTALGCCGVAWGAQGLIALQLPEADAATVRTRLQRRAPGAIEAAPSALAAQAMAGVSALLRGERVDLSQLALDLRGVPALHARIYDIVRRIPCGRTLSYGEVAAQLGDRQLARTVGQAMARNPFAPVVPCHRVLGANGQPGGFSARGGLRTKLQLLLVERAQLSSEPDLFANGT
jgi:methylated-DNA-[protein]-cysteine S-methyltransferase